MLSKIREASRLFRRRFGNLRGFLLWSNLLREKLYRKGAYFTVRIPGIRHPVTLRAHTSDVDVLCQIFAHAELDITEDQAVEYIVDAGANIGLASVFLTNRYPTAEIDALEIDSDNLRVLRTNAAPYPNIRVVEKGLWGHKALLKILNPDAESWAFRVQETTPDDLAGIPALGVQDLMVERGRSHIDILKLDVEGSEVNVLGESCQQWLPHVGTLLVELHDRFMPGCTEALNKAIQCSPHVISKSGEYVVVKFTAAR